MPPVTSSLEPSVVDLATDPFALMADLDRVSGVSAVRLMTQFDCRHGGRWWMVRLYIRSPLDPGGTDSGRPFKVSVMEGGRVSVRAVFSDWHQRPSQALAEALERYVAAERGGPA